MIADRGTATLHGEQTVRTNSVPWRGTCTSSFGRWSAWRPHVIARWNVARTRTNAGVRMAN